MKTLEQQVREIADREEIKELTAKYAHWVALGEGAKVAQLFTDDGVFINEIMGEKPNINVHGRKELDEFYPSLKRGMALPCIHNSHHRDRRRQCQGYLYDRGEDQPE
jgi:hypothetical protein